LGSTFVSILIAIKIEAHGAVAQLGEHLLCKQGVTGSIPVRSTNPKYTRNEDPPSPRLITVPSYHTRNAESFKATSELAVLQLQLQRPRVEQTAECSPERRKVKG
jgi:hypothetical protein